MTLPTPSQTVGPFFNIGLPGQKPPELVADGTDGAVRVEGTVFDGEGEPVPDALIEVWQANAAGRYGFLTVKPGPVPAPGGGMQAPHLAVSVFARGLLKQLATRIYFPDEEEANAADAILQSVDPERRSTLVASELDGRLRFDVRLQGDGETVFFDV